MNTDRCDHKVKKFFPYSFSLFHLLLSSLLLITFPLLLTPPLLTTYYFSPYSLFS